MLEVAGTDNPDKTAGLINGDFFREKLGIIQSKLLGELPGFLPSEMADAAWKALEEVA